MICRRCQPVAPSKEKAVIPFFSSARPIDKAIEEFRKRYSQATAAGCLSRDGKYSIKVFINHTVFETLKWKLPLAVQGFPIRYVMQ